MTRRRGGINPLTRLAITLGSASRNIAVPQYRAACAEAARTIPKCRAEIGGGVKGKMAREGRALLARLGELKPEQFDETAKLLRAYADAIGSRFEVTSETSLGERKRRA